MRPRHLVGAAALLFAQVARGEEPTGPVVGVDLGTTCARVIRSGARKLGRALRLWFIACQLKLCGRAQVLMRGHLPERQG